MKEENPFEDPTIAQEWIDAVEHDVDGSRDKEIYPLLQEWTTEIAPNLIVEIGAGQGICSSKISGYGKYIGVEPSAALVQRAKELYPEANKDFIVGSAYAVPVKDQVADAVFSVGVWFHLKDLDTAANELGRILKPGGKVLTLTSNPDNDAIWESFFSVKRVGNLLDGGVQLPAGKLSRNTLYLHSEEEVVSSLEMASIKVTSIKKFGIGKRLAGEEIWMAIEGVRT